MPAARSDERRWWITVLAMFAPVLLLAVVMAMTWRAERQYAAMTRRVINDYAAIAAWQYARRVNGALHDETMNAFRGIAAGHQRTSYSHPLAPAGEILEARTDTGPPLLVHGRTAFTYNFRSGELELAGDSLDVSARSMIHRQLRSLSVADRHAEPHRILFDTSSGRSFAIALWTIAAPDSPVSRVYGLVADANALRPRLSALIGEAGLLPGITISERLTPNDLAIRLTREDGGVVFATPPEPGSTAATDSIGLRLSGLRATVDIPPHMVSALLAGGATPSQLPALALMLVVATVLAAVGLRHERRARELTRARSRFVANVSHELRTPLAQISMFAETLKLGRERTEAERRQFASIIFTEARRLTALVESVLRFSRGDTDRERLRLERLELAAEIESAVAGFAPIADAAAARIRAELGPDVCGLVDRGAFRQIMLNLLDNAVKHGGRGTTVAITLSSTSEDVRILVDDSGPGIPPDFRERVFEPFVRVEHDNVAGAGIGLAVVKDLVTAHSGRVWVESSPLGGSRFVVSLPPAPSRAEVHSGSEQVSV